MASAFREIPEEVWEQHKSTILSLRFREKLPLEGKKTNDRNLIHVMRDDHKFEATPSQYESQLKKWKAAKNIKSEEWRLLLPVYNHLERKGLKPRVRLGDQILDDKKVKKARRYLKKGSVTHDTELLTCPTKNRIWRLEVCQPSGQYMEYSGKDSLSDLLDIPDSPAIPITDINNCFLAASNQNGINSTHQPITSVPSTQFTSFQSTQDNITLGISQPRANTPSSQPFAFQPIQDYVTWTARQSMVISPDLDFTTLPPSLDPNIAAKIDELASFLPLSEHILPDSSWSSSNDICNPIQSSNPGWLETQVVVSKGDIDFILQQMHQELRFPFNKNRELLNTQAILDQLQSLLYDNFPKQGSTNEFTLLQHETRSISGSLKTIFHSIVNSFSGLKGIPSAVILTILKVTPGVESDLFNCLRSENISISKPLADNIFRAAIEAGDPESLRMILKVTSGQPNEINVNRTLCEFNGWKFTSLAFATFLHHFEITRILLEYGARVYIPTEKSRLETCALRAIYESYVLRGYRSYLEYDSDPLQDTAVATQIVKLLLGNESRSVVRLLRPKYFSLTSSKLLEILVEAVPLEFHSELFISSPKASLHRECGTVESGLGWILRGLDSQTANRVIRNLVAKCEIMGCEPPCSAKHTQALDEALTLTILNYDFDLAEYLLRHTQPTMGNLTAAVSTEQLQIVDLILQRHGIAHNEASCHSDFSHVYTPRADSDFTCQKPTTPLAEAIRLKNYDLISRLEENGALNRAVERHVDLLAAVSATVEAANISYLRKLLPMLSSPISSTDTVSSVSETYRYTPHNAIVEAIELGHFEIAIELIVHFSNSGYVWSIKNSKILCAALEKKNRKLVDTIIECLGGFIDTCPPLIQAVHWGDRSVVEDLLQIGCVPDSRNHYHVEGSPLRAAIKTGNKELAILLLEWGSNPSELVSAVRNSDEDMVHLLLRYGANPADDGALSLAVRNENYKLISILLDAYSLRFPDGIKGFGGEALFLAIEARNSELLKLLLKSKLDVDCCTPTRRFNPFRPFGAISCVIRSYDENDNRAIRILDQLIEAGADLDAVNGDPASTAVLEAIKTNKIQFVELLLDKGANINRPARQRAKRTPLQQACEKRNLQMVEFLLDRGAEVNAPPAISGGATALQVACIQGSDKMVRLLLDKGADIHANAALVHGRTALEGAAEHGRISVLEILLAEGAAGYDMEAMESAKSYAQKQSHRGCEERLDLALYRRQSLCL